MNNFRDHVILSKFAQLIVFDYTHPVSGADLRNEAILQSLNQLGEVRQFQTPPELYRPANGIISSLNDSHFNPIVKFQPDYVIVEDVRLHSLVRELRKELPSAVFIADFHNIESLRLREDDRSRLPWFLKLTAPLIFARKWRSAHDDDIKMVSLCNAVWVCSKTDAARAKPFLSKDKLLMIVPNPIPIWCKNHQSMRPKFNSLSFRILYVGHLGYRPNKNAVRYLATKVFPRIKKINPTSTLVVAGRSPNRRLKQFLVRISGIELIANPSIVSEIYNHVDVAMLPITEGGGSRIKVLEAMAIGCPIIATNKAVEGLDLTPGVHFLLAETPTEFVNQLQSLSASQAILENLCLAAQKFVSENHSGAVINRSVALAIAKSENS